MSKSVQPGLPPWGPHVRFHRVQTLVREGSPSVKLLARLRTRHELGIYTSRAVPSLVGYSSPIARA